jgi:hypothetical protein
VDHILAVKPGSAKVTESQKDSNVLRDQKVKRGRKPLGLRMVPGTNKDNKRCTKSARHARQAERNDLR